MYIFSMIVDHNHSWERQRQTAITDLQTDSKILCHNSTWCSRSSQFLIDLYHMAQNLLASLWLNITSDK